MYIFLKKSTLVHTFGFLGIYNLIAIAPANAFTVTFNGTENLGFENQYNGWTTTGDTTVQSTFQSISPQSGNYQALITTACHDCVDNGSIRNDDSHINSTVSTFNYSDTNPITASVEQSNNLQSQLGISDNALSINAKLNGSEIADVYRTPKEGSGILSDEFIVSDDLFQISFDWNYLSNDGASVLGNQDFSFVTITGTEAGTNNNVQQVFTLGDSSSSIPTDPSSSFVYNTNYERYTTQAFAPGTYRIGFGVVDIDNVDRSSALLVDNLSVEEVPFEFSPTLGLLSVAGVFGWSRLRRKFKNKGNSTVG